MDLSDSKIKSKKHQRLINCQEVLCINADFNGNKMSSFEAKGCWAEQRDMLKE